MGHGIISISRAVYRHYEEQGLADTGGDAGGIGVVQV